MKGCIDKRNGKYGYTIDVGTHEDGRRRQKRFGGFSTKKACETALNNAIYQLEHGEFIMPTNLTVGQYLYDWLNNTAKPRVTETTFIGYANNVYNHLTPAIGKIQLQKLQASHILSLYNTKMGLTTAKTNEVLSSASIHSIHATLRAALNDGVKQKYISKNVAVGVQLPKLIRHEANFLDKGEVSEMLTAMKGDPIFTYVLIVVSLGLRRGELIGLKWADFDMEKLTVSVKRSAQYKKGVGVIYQECKTAKSVRTLAIPSNLMQPLKAHKEAYDRNKEFFGEDFIDTDAVCSKPNGMLLSPNSFNHSFTKALKRYDIPHIRLHDLRHSNASLLLSAGVNLGIISRRLGHSTISTTMDIYGHLAIEAQYEAVGKIDPIFAV